MHKLAITHVNPYVTEGAVQGIEKNQITWLQIAAFDGLGGRSLLVGSARQDQPDGLLVNGFDKTAAVKPGFNRVAAEF